MYYRTSFLLSLILLSLTTRIIASPLMMGSIKFPTTVNGLMPLPIFYDGRIIDNEVSENQRKISFEIPWVRGQQVIYILITEKSPENVYKPLLDKEGKYNTIDYLKVPNNQPYKLYKLSLVLELIPATTSTSASYALSWKVEAASLPDSGQIPDQTITILYFPSLVDSLDGGTDLNLPTLVMRNDMLALCQSEKILYDNTIKLQLSSLDSNAIHAPIKKAIQQNNAKTIIIGCVT